MARKRNPKMAAILFVGMSFLGNILPMISARLSFPTYLYSGFLIGITSFCMNRRGDLALNNFAEAD